jgi:uncharacterized flavoprotein (TIGR03862 family)
VNSRVAIVGSGPAGLMAATVVSRAGIPVTLFEKRKSIGRKLLVAGSSGLNISNDLPPDEFARHYTGPLELWKEWLTQFSPQAWIQFIEGLGIKTFLGTSGRYFIEDMKASRFLQTWREQLKEQGVDFALGQEVVDFTPEGELRFSEGPSQKFSAVCFSLGGGSWEDSPVVWPRMFEARGVTFHPFRPSNVGFRVDWPTALLAEAEGKPLKNVSLRSAKGIRRGEVMVTRYGVEGTPVYFVGQTGTAMLDLLPDLSVDQILEKFRRVKENLSPLRRVKKQLNLGEAALAVTFHCAPADVRSDGVRLAKWLKQVPLELKEPQPLSEAISSAGGIDLSEVDADLMLKKFPGIYCAGEMLDWDVPTGGFLIQGCVAQGFRVGTAIVKRCQLR